MTEAEFVDWQNYHESMFRGFGNWMLGISASGQNEPQEMVAIREKVFMDAFAQFDGDACKVASVALYKMPLAEKPKAYGDHLSALLEILRRPKGGAEIARRQPNCGLCLDSGLVNVTAKPGFALFSAAGLPMPHGVYASVACNCERGPKFPDDYQGLKRAVFDGSIMQVWKPKAIDPDDRLDAMAERGPMAADLSRILRRFVGRPERKPMQVDSDFIAEMEAIGD